MPALTVRDVFAACQKDMHCHGKLIKNLKKIYDTTPIDDFWKDFQHDLKFCMIVAKREPVVERTIEFAAKFATSLVKPDAESETPAPVRESLEEDDDDDDEDMHPFLLKFFSFLLKSHNANDKGVRFRVCQLINKLLNSMGEDAAIADSLYDRLYECLLLRLRDIVPVVRVQAVLAMTRLQDPRDNDCPVINAFLFLLNCDPNPDVRRAVLSCISASKKTLPAILERTRDTKDTVRRLAYQVLAEKVHVKALTIAQRVRLLQEGLNDREESVKDACASRLLQAWLCVYEGNILDMLKCLDVETSIKTSEQALKSIISKAPINELVANFAVLNDDLVVPVEELEAETVFYWRCLCQYLREMGPEGEEQLDKILPTGTTLSKYIASVRELMAGENDVDIRLRNEFILEQLLHLASVLDLSDEVGRRNLGNLLKQLLCEEEVSHSLVKPLMTLYTLLYTEPETRIIQLIEIISDIRMPITTITSSISKEEQRKLDLKVASVRVELNNLREDLDEAIHKQEFSRAAEIKDKVEDLESTKNSLMNESMPRSQENRVEKTDPGTLLKCLTITGEMLQDVQLTRLLPALITLIETLILPGVQSADPAVRNLGIRALGLCCLLDKQTAASHLVLFMQVSQLDIEAVKVSALETIFDLLVTFGLAAFDVDPEIGDDKEEEEEKEDEDEEEVTPASTASGIIAVLCSLLDSESPEVRTVAAEGLCKLLLSGRLVSAKLLSRLVLLWYNPITEADNYLRHCLGAFFPVYAFAGAGQAIVEEAFLPSLRTILQAPTSSPLSEVNVDNVADLLVQLTDVRHLVANQEKDTLTDIECCPHDNLALQVCNEVLSDPNSFDVRSLCKILVNLQLCPSNVSTLCDLRVLADRMAKEVKDKQCSKLVDKFQKQVYAMVAAANQPPPTPSRTPLGKSQSTSMLIDSSSNVLATPMVTVTGGDKEDERLPGENKENVIRSRGDSESYVTAEENSADSSMDKAEAGKDKLIDETILEDTSINMIRKKGSKKSVAASTSTASSTASTASSSSRRGTKKDTPADSISSGDEDDNVFQSPPPPPPASTQRRATRKQAAKPQPAVPHDSPARSTRKSTRKRANSRPLGDMLDN